MIDEKLTKAVNSVTSIEYERSKSVAISGRPLTASKCVRDNADTIYIDAGNRGNYFSSFNLPTSDTQITTGSSICLLNPELYQFNTDRFVLIKFQKSGFTEFIDARSVELMFTYTDSVPNIFQVNLYSSTYSGNEANKYGESNPMLGSNIAYLFSDDFNRPYSGSTVNELGEVVSRSGITSWNPTGQYKDRPSAVSFKEVQSNVNCINSDRRKYAYYSNPLKPGYPSFIGDAIMFSSVQNSGGFMQFSTESTHSFNVGDDIFVEFNSDPQFYNTGGTISSLTSNSITTDIVWNASVAGQTGGIYKGQEGVYYNYDIPLGFVCLDSGFIILTHKTLVDGFVFAVPGIPGDGFYEDGTQVGGFFNLPLKNIYFTGGSMSLSFTTLNKEYEKSISCTALLGEFYISNNVTWNREVAQNPIAEPPAVQITEAGFYNAFGELIAMSKFSEPVQKTQGDILSFDFNISI